MVHIPSRAKFQVFLSSEVHITQHQCQATRLRLQPIGLEGGGQLDHEPLDDDRQCGYLTTSSISKHTPNNNPYPKSRQLPKPNLCWQGSRKTFKPGSEEQEVSHPHLSPWNHANSPVGSVPDKTQECMASPEGREDHPHYLRSVPWYLWSGECQKLVYISALLLITPLINQFSCRQPFTLRFQWNYSSNM